MSESQVSNICIEPARPEHLPQIATLAATIWRAHYPGIITPEQIEYMLARMYDLETMRRELCEEGVRYFRLLRGADLIGFAAFGPTGDTGTARLHKLYLHPGCQRQGHGSRLLRHVEAEARTGGTAMLILNVNRRNHAAIAAYRKNGYRVRESVVLELGGGFVMDDFILEKALSPD